jgi:hypothetical protein
LEKSNLSKRPMTVGTMMRQPSGFLPVAMSCIAAAMVVGHVAAFGVASAADEGTAAHVFQLLLIGEIPLVLYFAIRWLPAFPRQGLAVLAVQGGAALVPPGMVMLLHL